MELKEIKQIVELMNKYELSYFHLEKDDFRIKLKKGMDADAVQEIYRAPQPAQAAPLADQPKPSADAASATPAEGANDEGGEPFKSPMVGTFYRSSTPESEPFVKVGQEIDEDTTLCIIEAMKTFNEIKAEQRGTVVKILVDNAKPVQFGDPLFIIKPA